jgi:hypothetical protein
MVPTVVVFQYTNLFINLVTTSGLQCFDMILWWQQPEKDLWWQRSEEENSQEEAHHWMERILPLPKATGVNPDTC